MVPDSLLSDLDILVHKIAAENGAIVRTGVSGDPHAIWVLSAATSKEKPRSFICAVSIAETELNDPRVFDFADKRAHNAIRLVRAANAKEEGKRETT